MGGGVIFGLGLNPNEVWDSLPSPMLATAREGSSSGRVFLGFGGGGGRKISMYGYARVNGETYPARFNWWGLGYEFQRCAMIAYRLPQRRSVVRVSAREFLSKPYRYGVRGYWVEKRVES